MAMVGAIMPPAEAPTVPIAGNRSRMDGTDYGHFRIPPGRHLLAMTAGFYLRVRW
jgi:hypothetical protein